MSNRVNNWKSFDGHELSAGEVLVPQLVTKEYARSIGAVMENLRTWTMAGVRFTVMFVPVPADMAEACRKTFNAEVNELLDEKLGSSRHGRCQISLDALMEEGYLPAGTGPSAEAIVMEGILLDELIAHVGKLNPLFGDVVRLGYQGLGRKEIVEGLPVKKSQGYEVYKKCREEAERWLNL